MRISTQPGDAGYREDASSWVVLLDGEPQSPAATGRAVITADEATGEVWYHPCADDGTLLMVGDFGCVLTERAVGKVSVFRIESFCLPRRGDAV